MLLCTSSREALLACPSLSPWNSLSFTVESTLSSPCSRSNPLYFAKVRLLPTLTLSPPPHALVLWTDSSVPFPFGKSSFGVLAICSLCGTEVTLFFRRAQYVQVFPLKPAPLCWSRQHQQVCHFSSFLLLSDSRFVLTALFFPFYLKLCGRSGRNCLLSPPVLSDYNGSPDTCFSRGTTRLMSWPDGVRYLRPPQSLVVSLLLSLVSSLVFSRTGGVLSHQNSLTHRFPRFPPRNLCSLVMLAVFSLVFAALDTAFF